jgi:hypothetical protein
MKVNDPLLRLIAKVGKPIDRKVEPVDLRPHADSLRLLIEHAKGTYQAQVDELKDKYDQIYKKVYDDNFIGPEPPLDPAYDYSDYSDDSGENDGEARRKGWAEHWEQFYKLPRGNPKFRDNQKIKGGPRPIYLYPVYDLIKWWWETRARVGKFKPDFVGIYGDGMDRYDFDWCNSAARLLYLIAMECDPGYTLENCANLQRDLRKRTMHE